ncbi:MAG: hypothetical protein V7K89_12570 [Nostoc sp.]|uniref:hypothetical protein n=1 Tax=Nostoc sp. TaxID=1180 RepID=UPI002FF46BE9
MKSTFLHSYLKLYVIAIALLDFVMLAWDILCHCECSASGMKQSQRLGLVGFTLVRSQSHQ